MVPISAKQNRGVRLSIPGARAASGSTEKSLDQTLLISFVSVEVAIQLGLFFFGNTAMRMPLRIGAFAASLMMLIWVGGNKKVAHPAARFVVPIGLVLAINLLNPDGDLLAGMAQATMYVAVLAPLIWAGRLQVSRGTFRRVVLILWGFQTASAATGALQVAYPGQFDGALAEVIDAKFASAMTITLADGQQILRPKGLTDSPGGAGVSGVYTIILGLGFLLTERSWLLRSVVILGMGISMFGIYLSQGRTNIVLVAIATLAVLVVLWRRGEQRKVTMLVSILAGVVTFGTAVAFVVGGAGTVDRFATLIAENPGAVAYANRGQFIDAIIEQDMYLYPLGAGGGRWGMMKGYFGSSSQGLYAEMFWQALLYDGGLPLIALYVAWLAVLFMVASRIAFMAKDSYTSYWGGITLGLICATVAASFVFPIYCKDPGLQMVLFNACLFGLSRETLLPVPERLHPGLGPVSA